jgi:hypothetical protein
MSETPISVFNPPIARPGRLLRSLPDIFRCILPDARYSSFLETLVAGSHPSDASARKTPSLPIQDDILSRDSCTRHRSTRGISTGISCPGAGLHSSLSPPDDLAFRTLYNTHGKFAWINGQKIEDVRALKWLGGVSHRCNIPAARPTHP